MISMMSNKQIMKVIPKMKLVQSAIPQLSSQQVRHFRKTPVRNFNITGTQFRHFWNTPKPEDEADEFSKILEEKRKKGQSLAEKIIEERSEAVKQGKKYEFSEEKQSEQEAEEEEVVGYMPPRPLHFDHKGEMLLFNLEGDAKRRNRIRQLPFAISTGLFTYLLFTNLNTFSFQTATFGSYAKIMAYWLFGWSPSVYLMRVIGRTMNFSVTEMRLLENGAEVRFTLYDGQEFRKKISDLHPMMDDKMMLAHSNSSIKELFYNFHSGGQLFIIDSLPKTNENVDIIQSVIHGIHIITDEQVE